MEGVRHGAFFPKADAAVLRSKFDPPSVRPHTVGPVLDTSESYKPIVPWSLSNKNHLYPDSAEDYAVATIPDKPADFSGRYLRPFMTRNERLRLTMLFYYTRHVFEDEELLSRIEEKVFLAKESIGWDMSIIGIIDHYSYTTLASSGFPLAMLPRCESLCAHSVNQAMECKVFLLPNLDNDWRFAAHPHSEAGLKAYAGAPLRLETEFGDTVALGSFCVASHTAQEPLTKSQQITLSRLADWVVADIVHSARAFRERERRKMVQLLGQAQEKFGDSDCEDFVMNMMKSIYPNAVINIQTNEAKQIFLEGREPLSFSEVEGGLWEDVQFIDAFIDQENHQQAPAQRTIRIVASKCDVATNIFLVIATKDLRFIFDDIDSWLCHSCASLLSRLWNARLLKEAMKTKDRFMRGITHSLRTPIHGILGCIELLAEDMTARNQLQKPAVDSTSLFTVPESADPFVYISAIKSSGQQLISTVNSMITLNRWEDVTKKGRVDVLQTFDGLESSLLSEVAKSFSAFARKNTNIIFNQNLPSNCDSIWIDDELLSSCLAPIVVNAYQNCPDGVIAVTISLINESKDLVIDIEDTGFGIHPDHQELIFHPYEKVDQLSTGAGLGLTLSSKFADILNGSVRLVSSVPGEGSHFKITFRGVTTACTQPEVLPLSQRLRNIPFKFYNPSSELGNSMLGNHFARFLTHHSFTSSESMNDSIIIIDHTSKTMTQYHSELDEANAKSIVLSIIVNASPHGENKVKNIVQITGPLLTSTLSAALEEADRMLSSFVMPEVPHLLPSGVFTTTVTRTPPETSHTDTLRRSSVASTAVGSTPASHADKPILPSLPSNELVALAAPSTLAKAISNFHIERPLVSDSLTTIARPRSLLVDDNAINLRILQMYCRKRKLLFHTAENGAEGVKTFTNQYASGSAVALVFMDLQMPICDGIEATRQIRALEKHHGWPRCVLFIVTGQDSPGDRQNAQDVGADEFFVKPVSIGILDRAVKQYFPAFEIG